MKLVLFNDDSLGVLKDGSVYDVSDVVKDIPHVTAQDLVNGVIAGFARLRPALEEAPNSSAGAPVSQVRLRPPLPRPGKIVAMAVNYLEFGLVTEPAPIHAFLKSSDAIIGPGDTIVLPEAEADIFHHEAELGVVIGKEARGVKEADAFDYIFGYVNFIDVSARGLAGGSFFWGKSWDTFAPLGPALVTAEEVSDPQDLPVKLWVNGDLRHDFSTSDMAHSIARCVEWASSVTTLEPGDVITTGTNHQGIGPVQDGDLVEMEIQGLERLTLHVKDSLKRQWPRGIDKRFADRMAGRG
jgi:2-keto-4-pentenoate hydratase/2-oxohepta-3-ene-1,7-dioic acid hydratase in catechol pathway